MKLHINFLVISIKWQHISKRKPNKIKSWILFKWLKNSQMSIPKRATDSFRKYMDSLQPHRKGQGWGTKEHTYLWPCPWQATSWKCKNKVLRHTLNSSKNFQGLTKGWLWGYNALAQETIKWRDTLSEQDRCDVRGLPPEQQGWRRKGESPHLGQGRLERSPWETASWLGCQRTGSSSYEGCWKQGIFNHLNA